MKTIISIIIITVCLPVVVFAADLSVPRNPKEIISATKQYGAHYVIAQLFNSDAWVKVVYPGISSGNSDWLDVAKELYPATDAGASEEMGDALSLALLKRPYAVLPILNKLWWQDTDSCYFAWDSEFPNMTVQEYVTRLEKALKASPPKETADLREACLKGIEKTRRELLQQKQNGK
jgi:hypothetical protein